LGKDRFLWGILLGIAALAVLAVILFFARQSGQEGYASEAAPEGVVRNYVLSLEGKDFQRAYAYLGEAEGKPSYERFRQDLMTMQMEASRASLQIGEVQVFEREAVVALVVIRGGGGPFEDTWREQTSALLERDEAGDWKIVRLPTPYWGWDWYNPQLIKPVPAVPGD